MAKSYKKKRELEEVIETNEELSKKEIYDLEKKKKLEEKEKNIKKTKNKAKKTSKKTNIAARIFAVFMLLLMVSSVIISALAYVLN